jgi:hypothetical protein
LQRRKTRTKRPELIAALAVAVGLTGCGSGSKPRAAPQPKLPRAVAASLAARSDEVAQALDGGDSCRALDVALRLQRETVAAINSRRVPTRFQEPLTSGVNDLVARIVCIPVEQPHERGKHKGEKHGEKD